MDHPFIKRRPSSDFRSLGPAGLIGKPGDPDVSAYLSAAGITNTTEKNAATTVILDLKSTGIWNQLDYLFLCSPTSLAAALVNAKTAVSATNSGATHSSSGMATVAANHFYGTEVNIGAYANFDFHCSVYSTPPNPSGGGGFIGYRNQQGRYNAGITVVPGTFNTPIFYGDTFSASALTAVGLYEPAGGMYLMNVDSSTSASIVINNGTPVVGTGSPVGINGMVAVGNAFPIGCCYNLSTDILAGGDATIKSATVGRRLTTQQKTDLYNIILTYQTALGRN